MSTFAPFSARGWGVKALGAIWQHFGSIMGAADLKG